MAFLIFNPEGFELSPREKEFFSHPYCAGAILFTKNYQSLPQLQNLIASIRKINPELLISVDHEGGRVQRFREGFTLLSSPQECAADYELHPEKTLQKIRNIGSTMVAELKKMDIDLNFTPVLDLDYGISQVISSRSFHRDPKIVTECADTLIKVMKQGELLSCGKHFPGHGGVAADSHHEIPIDTRDFETLWQNDMQPFRALASKLPAIMSAHVIYSACDDKPATFSSFWLRKILREKMQYSGVIFTDDLNMQAAQKYGSPLERVGLALEAGCDKTILCHDLKGVEQILSDISLRSFETISEKI